MTQQPMTPEETIARLTDRLGSIRMGKCIVEDAADLRCLELEEAETVAALHHLEAGKRALDERMDLAMAYAEGFKDGCHCYSEDPSPERYLDGNWNDSNTKKIWSAALSPTQDQA